jgi:hypothetical protein
VVGIPVGGHIVQPGDGEAAHQVVDILLAVQLEYNSDCAACRVRFHPMKGKTSGGHDGLALFAILAVCQCRTAGKAEGSFGYVWHMSSQNLHKKALTIIRESRHPKFRRYQYSTVNTVKQWLLLTTDHIFFKKLFSIMLSAAP